MINDNLNKKLYIDNYKTFIDKKIWGFVDKFFSLTNNVDKSINYFFAGNGASASVASHLSNDFSKTLRLKSQTFHDPAVITCLSNDYGYENWISEAIKIYGVQGDCLVLISSSGQSANIINSTIQAKKQGMLTVSLTGPSPSKILTDNSDICLKVDSKIYNIIECCHMIALCSIVDKIKLVSLEN